MANSALTEKDVIYAMAYMGERLCCWPNHKGGAAAWSLEPSGRKVPPAAANKARASGRIQGSPESRRGEARYVWVAA